MSSAWGDSWRAALIEGDVIGAAVVMAFICAGVIWYLAGVLEEWSDSE